MKVYVVGVEELNKKLLAMPDWGFTALKKAVKKSLLDLKGKSQRLAPIDKGDLRGSAYAKDSVTTKGIDGEVGFTEPYATRQHEEMDYQHPKGGQAKYLETPLHQYINRYIDDWSEAIKRALGG
jgi:hypothetical protein